MDILYANVQKIAKTDQPGRFIAVFIIAPILVCKGVQYSDEFIIIFSIILFLWDLYWICCKPPKVCEKYECTHVNHVSESPGSGIKLNPTD